MSTPYLDESPEQFNAGVDAAIKLLQDKANELRALNNTTSCMLACVFEEQIAAMKTLKY